MVSMDQRLRDIHQLATPATQPQHPDDTFVGAFVSITASKVGQTFAFGDPHITTALNAAHVDARVRAEWDEWLGQDGSPYFVMVWTEPGLDLDNFWFHNRIVPTHAAVAS